MIYLKYYAASLACKQRLTVKLKFAETPYLKQHSVLGIISLIYFIVCCHVTSKENGSVKKADPKRNSEVLPPPPVWV